MKILISNDDGIFAEGMRSLVAALVKEQHEVYVCVPDRERSATGHSMSLNKPLMVDPIRQSLILEGIAGGFVTSGTPADCVKVALGALWTNVKFDLMISGINHGPNLGIDVLYSGTVSAAMEAMLLGLPAIATSLHSYSSKEFTDAASWVADYIKDPQNYQVPEKTFLNINLPTGPRAEYKGIEYTQLGNRTYLENYEERQDPRGRMYFWLAGNPIEGTETEGTDGWAVLEHRVSITPVVFNMTNFSQLEKMKS